MPSLNLPKWLKTLLFITFVAGFSLLMQSKLLKSETGDFNWLGTSFGVLLLLIGGWRLWKA